jgi:Putative zincin peptidase
MPRTVRDLPDSYAEIFYLRVTEGNNMLWLNLISLVVFVISLPIFFGLLVLYHANDAPFIINGLPDSLSPYLGLGVVVLVFILHEWIHGLAIQYYGHKPRYGIKPLKGALFATADGAYFWRNQYLIVMLAPLGVISLLGVVLSIFVPAGMAVWLLLAAAANAAGATGDIWMARKTLAFPQLNLFQDLEDGMRVFADQS